MEGVAYVPNETWNRKSIDTVQTNGAVNGHNPAPNVIASIPVPKLLAEFAATITFKSLPTAVKDAMKTFVLDYIGNCSYSVGHSESSDFIFRGIEAFSNGSKGSSTVLTKGQTFAPQYAALLNAAFAQSLDFDDTFAAGTLHPGVTCISAAFAQAEISHVNGEQFLTSVAVGCEVVCRIARALGSGASDRGFHNTSTAGIFGAVAAVGHIKGLDAKTIECAFEIAGSQNAGSMQCLGMGAWNKRLNPGFAAHNALLSIALAEAGVHGSTDPTERRYGLLNGYSNLSTTTGLVDGLGKQWCSLETSTKPYPGCRITHGAIDLAAQMRDPSRAVKSLTLTIGADVFDIVGVPQPNKIHPKNVADAQFSACYQLAVAWLHGNTGGMSVYDRIADADVHELSDRITVQADPKLSGLATRLSVYWDDGSEDTEQLEKTQVRGEAENPMTMEKAAEKFMGLAEPVYGEEKARKIVEVVRELEGVESLEGLMGLIA